MIGIEDPTDQPSLNLSPYRLGFGHQFRGWASERLGQLEDRCDRRLVLPQFDQRDEVALHPGL
jgi:hypothetical protein